MNSLKKSNKERSSGVDEHHTYIYCLSRVADQQEHLLSATLKEGTGIHPKPYYRNLSREIIMKDNVVSSLIVGGLIGGSIILNGQLNQEQSVNSGGDSEVREVRVLRSGDMDELNVGEGGIDFQFEGSISEFENLPLESLNLSETLEETIRDALSNSGSMDGEGKIKIQLKGTQ